MSNSLDKLAEAFGKKPKKESNQKEEIIRTSFIKTEQVIYEQTSTHQFIDSTGQWHTEVFFDGLKHQPNIGEELEKGIVLLPDYPQEYGDIKELIEDIRAHIHKYYDCDEQHEKFAAWYVLLSWVFDRLNTINYLRALGDWGTGKSRFSDVVGRICYKPIIGSGAGSVAALKRMVNKWRGTVISDEGDFRNDDEKSELVKFYNLGFEKNRSIYQCDKNDPNKIEFYIPFCPKIIMTRRDFKDKALESRCLTHISQVTTRKDIPIHLPNVFYEEEKVLRNKLLKFRFDYFFQIDSDKVLSLDLGQIEPRLKQAMGSYAVLFANIPEMFDSFKEYLVKYQTDLIEDRASSFVGQIINKIADLLVDEGKEYITSKLVADSLESDGFHTNFRTIGKALKGLGLGTSEPKKIEGKAQRVLIFNEKFIEVCKRYIADTEKVTSVTNVTSVTRSRSCNQKQTQIPNNQKIAVHRTHVTDVTNVTAENEIIHQKCSVCELPESHIWQNGKPLCKYCYQKLHGS